MIDAGCGLGDFYTYISNYHDISYIGSDIVEENVSIIQERTNQTIMMKDILNEL